MIRKTALALAGLMMATSAYAAELKVGFIYVGPVGDFGWSYQHDQGVLPLRRSSGIGLRPPMWRACLRGRMRSG